MVDITIVNGDYNGLKTNKHCLVVTGTGTMGILTHRLSMNNVGNGMESSQLLLTHSMIFQRATL